MNLILMIQMNIMIQLKSINKSIFLNKISEIAFDKSSKQIQWMKIFEENNTITLTFAETQVIRDVAIILLPMLVILLLIITFPEIALWLPKTMMPGSFN